jgi:hypothetical protein
VEIALVGTGQAVFTFPDSIKYINELVVDSGDGVLFLSFPGLKKVNGKITLTASGRLGMLWSVQMPKLQFAGGLMVGGDDFSGMIGWVKAGGALALDDPVRLQSLNIQADRVRGGRVGVVDIESLASVGKVNVGGNVRLHLLAVNYAVSQPVNIDAVTVGPEFSGWIGRIELADVASLDQLTVKMAKASDARIDLFVVAGQRYSPWLSIVNLTLAGTMPIETDASNGNMPGITSAGSKFNSLHLSGINRLGTMKLSNGARCAFFDRNLHSRMPLVPTPARLKRAGV